ncbi:MAG: glucosamine-6-phosphate isomerase [Desulfitobacterium hafniense]|nr:glucosamine-6-phosphate isomerase [Desulfitobacterium hafniense]
MAIKLQIIEEKQEFYYQFARTIADEIKMNNDAGRITKLILPVGPVKHYPVLAEITNKERISWKNVWTFNMDEYLDWQGRIIPEAHPLSFKGFMSSFFASIDEKLRIPAEQAWFPDPARIDEISEKIAVLGGIDTCYGGVGVHGHIAFNEPPVSRFHQVSIEEFANSLTRIVPLAPETIVMNSIRNTGGNFADFPPLAVTLGLKDILNSSRIRLYCDGGDWQKTAVKEALEGQKRIDYPVTLLQDHPDAMIVATRETVSEIRTAL